MLICSNCGLEITNEIEFCPSCGTPAEFFKPLDYGSRIENTAKIDAYTAPGIDVDNFSSGQVITENLEIISKIGYNLICPVYRVYDHAQQIDKALIVLPHLLADHAEAMEYLSQEIKTKTHIKHPNILAVTDFKSSGPIKYIETEYSNGESLSFIKLNSARKRLSESGIRKIVPKIVKGLAYAHNHDLLHRNLKPHNILITQGGVIKIKDFGITDALRNALNMVQEFSSRESLLYMPPEQIRGKSLGVYSDIYSLGATMYDLLSGHPPFYKGDIYNQIIHEEAEEIPWVSPQMNRLLKKCLAKDPAYRFSHYDALLQEIRAMEPIKKPPTRITPGDEFKERRAKIAEHQKKLDAAQKQAEELKFKSGTRQFAAVITLIVFAILALLVARGSIKIPWINSQSKITKEEAWQKLDPDKRTKVEQLLRKADERFQSRNLVEPPGDNAYELYLQALTIFPQDDYAWNQIELIRKDFLERSRELMRNLNFREASRLLTSSLNYFPADSQLIQLNKEANRLIRDEASLEEPEIRILNANGRSGLAKKVARLLRTIYKYSVPQTDNYRQSGRLVWNEEHTYIKVYGDNNLKIQRLARQLGLRKIEFDSTLQKDTKRKYNIDIILGRDFDRLPIAKQLAE